MNDLDFVHLFEHGRAFHVRVVELTGPAPWHAPQSAHREDDGEARGH